MSDYYEILGVARNADKEDIKKAYRKLAHKYHPDKTKGDDKKFKELNEAYEILHDEKKRAEYDTYGKTSGGGGGGGSSQGFGGFDYGDFASGNGQGFEFDFGDIFENFFGGQRGGRSRAKRGADIAVDLNISFEDSIFGTERKYCFPKFLIAPFAKEAEPSQTRKWKNARLAKEREGYTNPGGLFSGRFLLSENAQNAPGKERFPPKNVPLVPDTAFPKKRGDNGQGPSGNKRRRSDKLAWTGRSGGWRNSRRPLCEVCRRQTPNFQKRRAESCYGFGY